MILKVYPHFPQFLGVENSVEKMSTVERCGIVDKFSTRPQKYPQTKRAIKSLFFFYSHITENRVSNTMWKKQDEPRAFQYSCDIFLINRLTLHSKRIYNL